jgi:hypothetical protein
MSNQKKKDVIVFDPQINQFPEELEPSTGELTSEISASDFIGGPVDDIVGELELRIRDSIAQGSVNPMTVVDRKYPITSLVRKGYDAVSRFINSNSDAGGSFGQATNGPKPLTDYDEKGKLRERRRKARSKRRKR